MDSALIIGGLVGAVLLLGGCATPPVHKDMTVSPPTAETADVAYRAQQWDRVSRLYRYLLTGEPDNALYLARLGVAASHRGDLAAAEGYLTRAVAADARFSEARYNLALVYLNLAHRQLVALDQGGADPQRRMRAQRMRNVLERLAALP